MGGFIDYEQLCSELKTSVLEEMIPFLRDTLPDLWCDQYEQMTPTAANILEFDADGFAYLFDFSTELVRDGLVPEDQAVDDRVVAVFGASQQSSGKRDVSRMRGFLGPSSKIFGRFSHGAYKYDKGHFIAHASGGCLDANLFPQRRDINRGWSKRGKIYRMMERYCAEHPETFCFSRPIYCERHWCPCMLEYGVLTTAGTLWVERFEN
jgi:hypothetical protein